MHKGILASTLIDSIDIHLPWLLPILESMEGLFPVVQRIQVLVVLSTVYLFFKFAQTRRQVRSCPQQERG